MSLDATRWAWLQKLSATRKLVLLSLADRADEQSVAHPSIVRLVKDTCLDRKTIIAAISELEQMGLLRVTRTHGSVSKYALVGVPHREDENQYQKRDQSQDWDQYQKRDGTSTKNGTATSTKNGTQNLPIEPTKNLTSKKPLQCSPTDMPEIAPELAQELLVYRKSLKKPLTKRAWDLIVSEAHKAGWPVQQAVEYLMAKSWQSFSAEYVQKQPQRTEPVRQRRYV